MASEKSLKFAATLRDVQVQTLTAKVAGETLENIDAMTAREMDAMRQSLIDRISRLEAIELEMQGELENSVLGVGSSANKAQLEETTALIAKLKTELKGVKTQMDDTYAFAALDQMDSLEAELKNLQDTRAQQEEEWRRLEGESAKNSEYLAERVAERKLTEHERVLA
ncbi:MAG: hypothetical protein GY862_38855, partial [Gammaproteobacteria bacterium]|nr:hypothetical protein [Gammaproteobacteria bacterium]